MQRVFLTSRQNEMLKLMLSEDNYQPLQYFSQKMGVSIRSIQNYLHDLKDFCNTEEIIIIKKPGVGIKLEASTSKRARLLSEVLTKRAGGQTDSINIRRLKMIAQLLVSKDKGTSINRLSEQFFLSKTSIVNDLTFVEKWAQNCNLALLKTKKGTRLAGEAEAFRKAIVEIINALEKNIGRHNKGRSERIPPATFQALSIVFGEEHVKRVEATLLQVEDKVLGLMNELYFVSIVTNILIDSVFKEHVTDRFRIAEEHFQAVNGTMLYATAQKIVFDLSKCHIVDVSPAEIHNVYCYLLSGGYQKHQESSIHPTVFNDANKSLVASFTNELISVISKNIDINFSENRKLYLGLLSHIKAMFHRFQYHIKVKNPLLEDVKKKYTALFSVIRLACSLMEDRYTIKVDDDELSFLTIYFQAAIEESKVYKRVVIVCSFGVGTSQLIANKIKHSVPQLDIVDCLAVPELNQLNLNAIDLIISTVPLQISSVPVIVISQLINFYDIKTIHQFIMKDEKKLIQCRHLKQILDNELIYLDLNYSTKQEILTFLCHQVIQRGYVKDGYLQSVLNREKQAPTCFGNGVALPHGESQYIIKPFIAIAVLRGRVDWGDTVWEDKSVTIVFLTGLKIDDPAHIQSIISDLYTLFNSQEALKAISTCRTETELVELFTG
ncbi:transcription antitermination protein BlgG [Pullulanibacillus camelliae]|uniref:Transcription antitermination protein BlgG n=1 Tax=Pullulanibacillus camelliae TaxID=1707096 RepID=A0A8J2YM68_9BACL|nr:BglG family transcription antiterminator [Pullulanibacillus camelliae]GGE52522.1 transcription antitermination protein BlgG [Pullulanibacillus camelliae]